MTQLNLVETKKRQSAPRPKAQGNQHLKDLEAIGYDVADIAEAFGLDSTTVRKYLNGSQECPSWTILAARQLRTERTGKPNLILIAPQKEDEAFIKDLLRRSGISFKELEV